MSFSKKLIVFSASFLLTACASMLNGKYQPVTVVPVGGDYENTECLMKNTHGEWVRSVERDTIVRRDYDPLEVTCKDGANEGFVSVESKTQWRYYWANFFIWDLCLISCAVDIATNAFYDYPAVIRVPMKPVSGVAQNQSAPQPSSQEPVLPTKVDPAPAQPVVTQTPRQTITPTAVRRASDRAEAVKTEPAVYAATGEAEWRSRAETVAVARDCVDLKVETQGDTGAMYSMLCRTGREMVMCSDVGCRVMD